MDHFYVSSKRSFHSISVLYREKITWKVLALSEVHNIFDINGNSSFANKSLFSTLNTRLQYLFTHRSDFIR
jgi:hypothetical protein